MNQQLGTKFPQFFLTVPGPCPYLEGRLERKVFTQLHGSLAVPLNEALTHAGFRRSQNIAYKPACETCNACVSVRIVADQFQSTRSLRRVERRNRDLKIVNRPAIATDEQFALLRGYLDARHPDGGMSDMTILDFAAMVEDSAVRTHLVEYRDPSIPDQWDDHPGGQLVGVSLIDSLSDGPSMVYSFFDPAWEDRSLGTFMVLDQVHRAREHSLPYVYLGYWVAGCGKMDYKARFKPLQALRSGGWGTFEIS